MPCLVRVLDYERPLQPGSRHDPEDVAEVTFARATRGQRIERSPLVDGTVVELGRTAFLFRLGPPTDRKDVTAAELVAALPGLTSFSMAFGTRLAAAARLARSGQSLVLHGETGTGKEVVARGVHVASGRSGPFIGVNCAALPPNLIESELFGFRKGAFSGATEDRAGLIRGAQHGTLFLDEIGDLPAATQVALLRVLQEKEVMPVGAARAVPVDIRVIVASHRDLERHTPVTPGPGALAGSDSCAGPAAAF